MPSTSQVWITVVLLFVCWSPRAISMDPSVLQERQEDLASRRAVRQAHTPTPHESAPMLLAQWGPGSQGNACACPVIICSELQRSEACRVSCSRDRSAYCQCGSCNGIALSSPNYCGCR
jgi:hypothetical protein